MRTQWDDQHGYSDESPRQESMRAGLKPAQRKAPSQDQKRVRREMQRKTATQIDTTLASPDGRVNVNPGDAIRLPTGETTKVKSIRRHETSGDHYYLDTDLGTTVVPYHTKVSLVPSETRSQALPSYTDTRANTNTLPGDVQQSHPDKPEGSDKCPVCGGHSVKEKGTKDVCSECGYSTEARGGMSFSDARQFLNPEEWGRRESYLSRISSVSLDPSTGPVLRGAVSRRAKQVCDLLMKENAL